MFNKTSPAASVILGSNSNGKIEWVTANGGNLHSLQKYSQGRK